MLFTMSLILGAGAISSGIFGQFLVQTTLGIVILIGAFFRKGVTLEDAKLGFMSSCRNFVKRVKVLDFAYILAGIDVKSQKINMKS